jgi:hypothetical protein
MVDEPLREVHSSGHLVEKGNPNMSDAEQDVEEETQPEGKKKRAKTVAGFPKAQYLGGLPGSKASGGNLLFNHEGVGVGVMSPKKGFVPWGDAAGISFDSNTIKKSRAGKALAFGVFALGARNTQSAADITVVLKDGNAAMYQVPGVTGQRVRGKVNALLVEHGIPCLDDGMVESSPVDPLPPIPTPTLAASAADEIAKLAALRDAGALTEEEFVAHKAALLS